MKDINNYKEVFQKILREIEFLSNELHLPIVTKRAKTVTERVKDDKFRIVVLGEFNRGKSTLLNAMLGAEILPTGEQETTAAIHLIKYSEKPQIIIYKSNGEKEEKAFSKDVLKEYTALKDYNPLNIKYIQIGYPADFLKNQVEIVDTPGVNDPDEHRSEITFGYIPNSNAVIFVLDAKQAFTQSEKAFIDEHLLKRSISSIFYILNRTDEVGESGLAKILENTKAKIKDCIGGESEPIVLPVSALEALECKLENNEYLIESTGLPQLTEKLIKFLNSDERLKAKMSVLKTQISALIKMIDDSLLVTISTTQKSIDELKTIKNNINKEKSKFEKELRDILKNMDNELENLLQTIESKLYERFDDLRENLNTEIKMLRGNLKEYAETKLPYNYKKYLKEWLDRYSDGVDKQLKLIAVNAINEFEKKFSKRAIINNQESQYALQKGSPSNEISVSLMDETVNEKIALGLGAVALIGVTAFATGGLSLIYLAFTGYSGAMIGKNIYSTLVSRKLLETQKQFLLENLEVKLNEDFKELNMNIRRNATEVFEGIKNSLSQQFENNFLDVCKELENRIAEYTKMQNSKNSVVTDCEKKRSELAKLSKELE